MTETHKVAKVGDKFFVAHKKDGWVDAAGKSVNVSASPKKTKFLTVADASAQGFSPSEVQKAALAAWATPVLVDPPKK